MIGGKGDDTYVVDDIGDVVTEAAGEGVDTIETDVVTYGADILGYVSTRFSLMAFAQVENLTYTGTSDFKGYGNDLDNVIIGGAGRDILDGGAGADTLIGGDGNDAYYIDDEGDAIVETENGGGDFAWVPFSSVDLSDFYARYGNVEGVGYTGRSDFTAHGTEGVVADATGDDVGAGVAGTLEVDLAGVGEVFDAAIGLDARLAVRGPERVDLWSSVHEQVFPEG